MSYHIQILVLVDESYEKNVGKWARKVRQTMKTENNER